MANHPTTPPTAYSQGQPRFLVDLTRPLPDAGGGVETYAATDRHDPGLSLIALRVARSAPLRSDVIDPLRERIDHLMRPVGHGHGPAADTPSGYYVFTQAPPGQPLSAAPKPWPESALLTHVLRPIAQILVALESRGLTHRGIRLNNVFRGSDNAPVVLGAAWSEPPAFRQPALFDPPYSAACHPSGRGNGCIADDVYALGVLMIVLALGRTPHARLDETAIIERKLSLGSFAALTNDERLPPIIADLARNMLAEDPEHRPPPALLLDPIAARGRRVAARPPHRAQRSLRIGSSQVWDARGLAFAIGRDAVAGMQSLRSGETTQWLRRSLGDAGLAARLEEFQRNRVTEGSAQDQRLDTWLLMRVITQIDPLAPLLWRGVSLWPDGLGPLMAAGAEQQAIAAEIVSEDVVPLWMSMQDDMSAIVRSRAESQRQRAILQVRGPSGGPVRLLYSLNPMQPSGSPLIADRWVASLADLAPALDAAIGRGEGADDPLDPHILAFIAVRAERRLDKEVNALNASAPDGERLTSLLRLLAAVQTRFFPYPLPAITAWFAARGGPLVALWHHRPKRKEVAATLNSLSAQGFLAPMLQLVADATARDADESGAEYARQQLAAIDMELGAIAGGAAARASYADRIGQEVVAGCGLVALAVVLILTALG